MILDNVRYQCKETQVWLEENTAKIELHFLSAYSLQFNPIEKLWKATKKASTHNRYFENLDQLHKTLFRQIQQIPREPLLLRGSVKSSKPTKMKALFYKKLINSWVYGDQEEEFCFGWCRLRLQTYPHFCERKHKPQECSLKKFRPQYEIPGDRLPACERNQS